MKEEVLKLGTLEQEGKRVIRTAVFVLALGGSFYEEGSNRGTYKHFREKC